MRIVAGEMRGFRLKSPKGMDTRPTPDRVKESLFSIIGYIDSTSKVLDLFSGSAAVGLEFISRGAETAYFIDKSSDSITAIKYNIEKCKVKDRTKVFKNDVFKAIEILGKKREKFDYIFLDPPYEQGLAEKSLKKIFESDILNEEGLIIVEHEGNLVLEEKYGDLIKSDSRVYGTTGLSFYRK